MAGEAQCFAIRRGDIRFRAEPFYNLPEHRALEARLLSLTIPTLPIADPRVSTRIIEGRITPAPECYSDDPSHPVFLRAQNIGEGMLDFSDARRLLPAAFTKDKDAILEDDDIVLTIDGALLGKAAVHRAGEEACCISNHMVRIHHGSEVTADYLTHFLNSLVGQKQIKRGITGSAIPGIRTDAIGRILVPIPLPKKQCELVAVMDAARAERRAKLAEADALLAGLDDFLLATLGLTPPPKDDRRVFAVRAKDVPGRFDPHFFLPALLQNMRMLSDAGAEPLGSLVSFSDEIWTPSEHEKPTFRYIEISSVSPLTGEASAEETRVVEAPSRARMAVRTGDIIVSLTRPHHGSIAQIMPDLNGCVASTGFSVLRSINESRVNREYLWCVLRTKMCLQQMLQRASGGNYPAITEAELAKVLLPVPKPAVQETVAAEARRRREEARRLRAVGEAGWQAAKRWFEEQLLGGAK